jgi:hypothetical protein
MSTSPTINVGAPIPEIRAPTNDENNQLQEDHNNVLWGPQC